MKKRKLTFKEISDGIREAIIYTSLKYHKNSLHKTQAIFGIRKCPYCGKKTRLNKS